MSAPLAGTAQTRELEVGYFEHGPRDGVPVLLYHGFPDDARTWDRVARELAAAGYRAIAPFVRGFGATKVKEGFVKSGEVAALARDVLEFADALGLGRFHYVGHDWGARAGYAAAILDPCRIISLSALAVVYGTNVPSQRLSIEQVRAYWYQWYFATPRGEAELAQNAYAFCRALWTWWSPDWNFDDAEYDATADSFRNRDFVWVTLSSYRQRWGFVPGAPQYAHDRAHLETLPQVRAPALVVMGADDGVTLLSSIQGSESHFSGPYEVDVVPGCGHFLQRERAATVAERILGHLRRYDTG